MKKAAAMILCMLAIAGPVYAEGDLPQVKSYGEALSISYLQRAYFALEQALFYAEKSRTARPLPSFNYARLTADIEHIEKDMKAYLYPQNEKLTGSSVPFKINGDYFLDEILNLK